MSLSKVTSVGGEPLGGYRKQERAGTAQRTGKEGSMRAMERCGEAGKGTWRSKGSVVSRWGAGQGTRRQQGGLEAAGGVIQGTSTNMGLKTGAMCNLLFITYMISNISYISYIVYYPICIII